MSMRADLEELLREVTLITLAFAIALGWSLYQVASGFAYFVSILLQRFSAEEFGSPASDLSWQVGHRVLAFGALVRGLVELGLVLGVILLVRRRFPIRR
jgi:hypothetical protein